MPRQASAEKDNPVCRMHRDYDKDWGTTVPVHDGTNTRGRSPLDFCPYDVGGGILGCGFGVWVWVWVWLGEGGNTGGRRKYRRGEEILEGWGCCPDNTNTVLLEFSFVK